MLALLNGIIFCSYNYMLKKTPKKLGRIKHVPKNLGVFFQISFLFFIFGR